MWRITGYMLVLFLIVAVMATTASVAFYQSTPTLQATPTPTLTLFDDGTCSPPCWFGLTPGYSNTQDVERFFLLHEDLFQAEPVLVIGASDPETGYLLEGVYQFYWDPAEFELGNYIQFGNQIRIQDGTVQSINVEMNRWVFLDDVLAILGPPEYVQLGRNSYSVFISLTLGYPDLQLSVVLWADTVVDVCNTAVIRDVFWVNAVWMFDTPDIPVSASRDERYVPRETWQAWLSGEVDLSCWEAWDQLL